MSILDTSTYSNGEMDEWIEKRHWLLNTFKGKVSSVLIVDPNNKMPLDEIERSNPELNLKCFDLADCNDGDFNRIGQHLNQYIDNGVCAYDGLLFDNIDSINADKDTEDLQTMVWQSLKRDRSDDGGYQILPFGEPVPFDKMMIAVRCKEIPEYLKGQSLQAVIIEV